MEKEKAQDTAVEGYESWERNIDRAVKGLILVGVMWLINTSNTNDTVNQLQNQTIESQAKLIEKMDGEMKLLNAEIRSIKSTRYTDSDAKRDVAPIMIDLEYIKKDIQEIKTLLKK